MAINVYNWVKDSGNSYTNFDAWVADQGSTQRSLSIGTDVTITGNLNIPSNIDFVNFVNGAKLIGPGVTVTINKMSAQPRYQIFDTGLNILFGPNAVSFVLPDWFGSGNGNIQVGSGITTPLSKIYVDGGVAIGTNVNAGTNSLVVAGSGSFTGVVHGAAPTVNTHLTPKLYVDTASGALNTRINNSGEYAANVSGQLNTYITNTSGQLNSRLLNISGVLIGRTTSTTTTLLSTEGILRCSGTFQVNLYQSTGSLRVHHIKNVGSGTITISGYGSDVIDGVNTLDILPGISGGYPNLMIYDGVSGCWDIL